MIPLKGVSTVCVCFPFHVYFAGDDKAGSEGLGGSPWCWRLKVCSYTTHPHCLLNSAVWSPKFLANGTERMKIETKMIGLRGL